ncbi:hypothetical protein F66182_6865 [Fusarium sp. NRRL 66182]|nr:hypothetical protein F66182_6865 [Fusarium sp. NRRL 66182]
MATLYEEDVAVFLYFLPDHSLTQVLRDVALSTADPLTTIARSKSHTCPPSLNPSPRTGYDMIDLALCKNDVVMLRGYSRLFGPLSTLLPLRHRDPKDGQQTELVRLAEAFFQRRVYAHHFKKVFEWFIGNDATVHDLSASDLMPARLYYATRSMRPRPPIDHLAEMLKWSTTNAEMKTLCEMIDMLCERGAVIDLHQDRFRLRGQREYLRQASLDPIKRPDNAVEIAMLPHCPSSFLANLLKPRSRGNEAFTARSKLWRRFGPDLPRGQHRAVTNMEWIVTRIYLELFAENNLHKHTAHSKMVILYENKLNCLLSANLTDPIELDALRKLFEAVAEIQKTSASGDSDRKDFGAESWFNLCQAVSCLATETYHTKMKQDAERFGERRHQFWINDSWDPRIQWIQWKAEEEIQALKTPFEGPASEQLFETWRQLVLERGEKRRWFDVVEQTKWFIPMEEAKIALSNSNPLVMAALGV